MSCLLPDVRKHQVIVCAAADYIYIEKLHSFLHMNGVKGWVTLKFQGNSR